MRFDEAFYKPHALALGTNERKILALAKVSEQLKPSSLSAKATCLKARLLESDVTFFSSIV